MCLIYRIIWGKTRLDNKQFKVEWCCQPSTNFHKSIKALSSLLGSSLEFFFLSKIFFFLQDCRSNYLYRGISSRDKKVTRHDFCLSLIKKTRSVSFQINSRRTLFRLLSIPSSYWCQELHKFGTTSSFIYQLCDQSTMFQ